MRVPGSGWGMFGIGVGCGGFGVGAGDVGLGAGAGFELLIFTSCRFVQLIEVFLGWPLVGKGMKFAVLHATSRIGLRYLRQSTG